MLGNYNQQAYNQSKGLGPTSRLYYHGKGNENQGEMLQKPMLLFRARLNR